MIRVSRKLSIALRETIRLHAETYHGGTMDMDRTLSAIGDLVRGLLAEIRDPELRDSYFTALTKDIKNAAQQKLDPCLCRTPT
jgi:hypothetical protein